MHTLKAFLNEQAQKEDLVVFDIDETLFQTFAKIKVVKDGKTIASLNNQEFNNYKLKDGEKFDFGEFADAKAFRETSKPIIKMINRAKQIVDSGTKKVIIITARADFDDRKVFLQTFRDHGIDIDKIFVERAGNLGLGSSAKNKRYIFHKYLKSGKFKKVQFFDDALSNITMFNALKKSYPDVDFTGYLVNHDGSIRKT